ncbi:MAG TPA: TolC family protein [Chitinispirillaceae bacterium]|nr:TolC family protein [Chitinispirillaceae bacterium]
MDIGKIFKGVRFSRILVLVLLMVLIDSRVSKGEEIKQFSFSDVLRMAADQGLAVLRAENVIAERENSLRQSKGAFHPSLSAGLSTGKSITFPDGHSSPAQGSANLNMNYSLSASSFSSHMAAQHNLQSATASLEQTRDEMMFEAAQKYIAVISAQAAIGVQKADLESQIQQLEQINAFYNHGRKAISDVLQQKTVVSETQSRLLRAQYEFENKKMELLTFLGLPLASAVQFKDSEIWKIAKEFSNIDSSTIKKPDDIEIHEITAQKNTLAATQKNLDAAKRAWWPSLDFSASISDNIIFSDIGSGNDGANARIGVSVSIPILDKTQRSSRITSAEISLHSAHLRLEELERNIRLSEQKARLNFSLAQKQTEVVGTRLQSAKQSLDAIQERYAVGAATITEVSAVNTQYLNARVADIDARLQIVSSYMNILHENGVIADIVDKYSKLPEEETEK